MERLFLGLLTFVFYVFCFGCCCRCFVCISSLCLCFLGFVLGLGCGFGFVWLLLWLWMRFFNMVVAYTLLVVPMIAKKPQKTRQALLIPFEKKISRTKICLLYTSPSP